jgi:hypothetical protein
MTRDEVMRWVRAYERAWREADVDAVEVLFAEGASYRPSPYDDATVGHDAIKTIWVDDEKVCT